MTIEELIDRAHKCLPSDASEPPLTLYQILENLRTQSSRATSHPQFQVWDNRGFIQQFFTHEAARRHTRVQHHNLDEPYIFVESGFRNEEWQLIRHLLLFLAEEYG